VTRETDRTEALRTELLRGIVETTGMREVLALPIANGLLTVLQREYGGRNMYVPAPARTYPVLQIAAALESGRTPEQVRHDFGLSRTKLYELFPGGLPKPRKDAAA
jgi:Mor family transcriptional regulator